nr:hypothetical protein B0A51_09624 [Rachicladosporium sp. CCFEE 5018]
MQSNFMAASPTWHSHEMRAKSMSTTTHDGDDNSILEHEYFKHANSIDEDTFDTLVATDLGPLPNLDNNKQSVAGGIEEDETKYSPTVVASIEEPEMDYRTHASASSSSSYANPFADIDGLPVCTAPPSSMPLPMAPTAAWDGGLVAQPYNYPAFDGSAYDFRDHYYQEPMAPQQPQHMYSPQDHHPSPYSAFSREQSTYTLYKQPEEDEYDEELEGGEGSDPCYAQLLYRCLRDAPSHTLSLRELYKWVQAHSQKDKDSNSKGWQNSVRHNLSMNAAFERVSASSLQSPSASATAPKRGSLWRLTAHALAEGVISTTRYRKNPKRKPERRSIPAPKRQQSGAKGGQATREASARRRAMQARLQNRVLRGVTSMPSSSRPSPGPGMDFGMRQSPMPYYLLQHPLAPPAPPAPPPPHLHQQHLHLQTTMQDPFHYSTPTPTYPPQTNLTPMLATPPQLPVSLPHSFSTHQQQPSKGLFEEFELGHLKPEDRMLFGTMDSYGQPDTPFSEEGSLFSEAIMGFGEGVEEV